MHLYAKSRTYERSSHLLKCKLKVSNYSIQGLWYSCLACLCSTYLVLKLAVFTHSLHGNDIGLQLRRHPHQPVEGLCDLQSPKKTDFFLELIIATRITITIALINLWHKQYLQCVCWESKCITDIKSVGYGQANQATVQRVSWNDGKQSREKHHQVPEKLQADGEPSAEGTNTHTTCTQI